LKITLNEAEMKTLKNLTSHKGIKLTKATTEVKVDASPQEVWRALSKYANVSTIHGGVQASVPGISGDNEARLGAERTCTILDGRREVTLVERITEFEEGIFYRYQVYEWKNFPLKVMFFAFSIKTNKKGETILSLTQNYRLNPGFLTGLMTWKIKKQQRTILLGYKHYMETGEKNKSVDDLFAMREYRYAFS
jgi:Polyketide cyclase / dehydrase and lipid transport